MKKALKAILVVCLVVGFALLMPKSKVTEDPGNVPCHLPQSNCPTEN